MLKVLLILMLLASPCIASENCTYTTDEVLEMITLARFGGWGEVGGLDDALSWNSGILPYDTHFSNVLRYNRYIQDYNRMLREHFNQTVQERYGIKEYTL